MHLSPFTAFSPSKVLPLGPAQLHYSKRWNVSSLLHHSIVFVSSISIGFLSECSHRYTIEFSNKWYVDEDGEVCKQDCLEDASSSSCGGPFEGWGHLFETPEACCVTKLSWVPTSTCVQMSLGQAVSGSRKWWVDWVNFKVSFLRFHSWLVHEVSDLNMRL